GTHAGHPAGAGLLIGAGAVWGALTALPRRPFLLETTPHLRARLRRLRVRLRTWDGWQYGTRLTLCLAAAEIIGQLWRQPTGAWIAVTVAIVVARRPDGAPRRPLERALGTLAGVALVALVLAQSPPAWVSILVVGVLAALRPLLRERSYTLYAAVMTPLVLLLMGDATAATAGYRLADTAIGCGLAFVLGYLPWRSRAVLD
ncbi:MAG: FUSC family protein, partial [Nonomuraea sp.]|nr:FUSC family protein [Nonomuraea sp.]